MSCQGHPAAKCSAKILAFQVGTPMEKANDFSSQEGFSATLQITGNTQNLSKTLAIQIRCPKQEGKELPVYKVKAMKCYH